jgi:AcrR family transcriptional regulator
MPRFLSVTIRTLVQGFGYRGRDQREDRFVMARTGRRPGPSTTRDELLAAAGTAFGTLGYEATSVRKIAADAGVDPALIRRLFGSKEQLFTAVVATAIDPDLMVHSVLEGSLEGVGERLARYYLGRLGEVAQPGAALALIRSAVGSPHAAVLVRTFLAERVLSTIAAAVGADEPDLRAALVASQLVGIAVARHAIRLEPLVAIDINRLGRLIGPILQQYLTAPLEQAPSPI